jgi:hypothetical protein
MLFTPEPVRVPFVPAPDILLPFFLRSYRLGREASGNGGSGKWTLIKKNDNENILYLNGLAGDESADEWYNEKIEIIFIDMFHMKMIRERGYEQNFEK